ncbi:high-affinity Zinc uptake system membrane protein ZnuB [Clostridium putrefaciens]|uniref:High-affinity Zinc uptake system membrane protein ZnuB n=1 Tax=Clostridium putrefaciens TaxID=99675 RepID=A0A381JBR5_9CLOT|nr:metal ABC transporter permease [Clostridium putrefaciens]SUY47876.1 high-affinity Zinc uptake system membrane protein ZnuB [Clostridium putrefaciens]
MLQFEFMRNALMAGLFVSILCPFVGLFLVLKRYSMMGDTLSHASFAGIAIGLVSGLNPIITSFIFTSACGLLIEYLRNYYKKYSELVMSIILTLSIGIAILIMSTGKAGSSVNSILFGNMLTVSKTDLIWMAIIGAISFIFIFFLYNKLIYATFDEEGAKVSGVNVSLVNYIFTLIVAATISISIRILGVLVISSMIVVPVATAMQLKKGFKSTLIYSILFGFIDIFAGFFISYKLDTATGGTIALTSVVVLTIILLINKYRR